jgi:DNA-binding PadR family transcriptional regulator
MGLIRRTRMHGYQLHEFIERNLATCTDLKKPTAYFLLDKLVKQGWLTQAEEREGQRPPRQVYQITAVGEAHFQHLLRENLAHYTMTRFTGDIGLAFADALPAAEVISLLEQRRAAMSAALTRVREAPRHAGSLQLIVDHYITHLEAELLWLDRVIARFAAAIQNEG